MRLVLFSLLGIAPPAIVTLGLLGIDVGEWTGLDHSFDVVVVAIAGLALVTAIALPMVCLSLRSPGPTRIDVDGSGVTEWIGGEVRTSIPWERSAVYLLETTIDDRRFGRRYVGAVAFSITSERGYAINTGWGSWARWSQKVLRRRTWSANEFPVTAITSQIGPQVQKLGDMFWDRRDERRGLFWFSRIVGVLFLGAVGGGVAQATSDLGTNGAQLTGALFALASLLMLLRTLRPLVENVRVSRDAAPASRGVPMTLQGDAIGTFVRAQNAQGQPLTLDCSQIAHPDARFAQRGGTAFVALAESVAVGGGGYRDAPLRVTAIDTPLQRRERSRIRLANRLEILARVTLSIMLMVSAAVLLSGEQVH